MPIVAAMLVLIAAALSAGPSAQQIAEKPKGRLNPMIEQLEQGKPAFADDHWLFIDMEHGPYRIDEIPRILAGLRPDGAARPKITPVVRIPQEGDEVFKSTIKQLLDQGVMGIIVPHVENEEQATKLVQAMRYPPQRGAAYPDPHGVRGWGPTRAARYWGVTTAEYAVKADVWPLNPAGELMAIVMIESREGVRHINEILKVPGLGAALILSLIHI